MTTPIIGSSLPFTAVPQVVHMYVKNMSISLVLVMAYTKQSLGLFVHRTKAACVKAKTFSTPKSCCEGDPQMEHRTPFIHKDVSEIADLTWVCNHCKGERHEAPALNELLWAMLLFLFIFLLLSRDTSSYWLGREEK